MPPTSFSNNSFDLLPRDGSLGDRASLMATICLTDDPLSLPGVPAGTREALRASIQAGDAHGIHDLSSLARSQASQFRPTIIKDEPTWECAGAVCRRVQLMVEDTAAVVFVSDQNSEGRSITNVMEHLIEESRGRVFFKTPDGAEVQAQKVRFFERRTGGRTAGDVPQSDDFQEVIVEKGQPSWIPCRDTFSKIVLAHL